MNCSDIVLYDITDRSITVLSKNGDRQYDGHSGSVSLGSDGAWLAFESEAPNVVEGDTNGQPDDFVMHLPTKGVARVSLADGGGQLGSEASLADPANRFCRWLCGDVEVSDDGSSAFFDSWNGSVVAGDLNARSDVFLHLPASRETRLVSANAQGLQGNDASYLPASEGRVVSSDGRYVLFNSYASNLVEEDIPLCPQTFSATFVTLRCANSYRKDLQTGELLLASSDAQGRPFPYGTDPATMDLSGRFVAFVAEKGPASGPQRPEEGADVWWKDLATGEARCASEGGSALSHAASISPDGRFVSYVQDGALWVYDSQADLRTQVRPPEDGVRGALLSAGATAVAFDTEARLLPADENDWIDVYWEDLAGMPWIAP